MIALLMGLVFAGDVTLVHQMRALDQFGDPRSGTANVVAVLSRPSGTELWRRTFTGVTFEQGYLTLRLDTADNGDGIDSAWSSDEIRLQLSVDGQPLGPAQTLVWPARAEHAASVDVVATASGSCTAGRVVFDAATDLLTVCDETGVWRSLPADLLDGDNDTQRAAGTGLSLSGNTLSVDAGRVGVASTYEKLVHARSQGHISAAGNKGIWIDGTQILSIGRGYNVASIRLSDGVVTHTESFDTYGVPSRAADMATWLNSLGSDQLLVVTTWDEPKLNRLGGGLPAALYRCGASPSVFGNDGQWYTQSAYLLVGVCGYGAGSGEEFYTGDQNADPTAAIDYGFILRDGVWIR